MVTIELLDCALIGLCVVIRSNTVDKVYSIFEQQWFGSFEQLYSFTPCSFQAGANIVSVCCSSLDFRSIPGCLCLHTRGMLYREREIKLAKFLNLLKKYLTTLYLINNSILKKKENLGC